MYIILGTCPVIARQLNWELVDQFMTYRTLIILKPNTNGMWRAADKKPLLYQFRQVILIYFFPALILSLD